MRYLNYHWKKNKTNELKFSYNVTKPTKQTPRPKTRQLINAQKLSINGLGYIHSSFHMSRNQVAHTHSPRATSVFCLSWIGTFFFRAFSKRTHTTKQEIVKDYEKCFFACQNMEIKASDRYSRLIKTYKSLVEW